MKTRVVIADDEAIIRTDIKERLDMKGYNVVGEAGDGFDAVELCRNLKPDLVLLDVKMPMLDGITAAKIINDEKLADCIVMLTAYSDSKFVEKASQSGVMGYVVKPVEDSSLFPTIEVALNRSREMTEMKEKVLESEKKLLERKVIERAKGVLIKRNNMTEKEAYEYIRSVSMNKRKSMKEVADVILINEKNIFE